MNLHLNPTELSIVQRKHFKKPVRLLHCWAHRESSQDSTNHMRKGVGEEAEIPEKSESGLMLRNKWRGKTAEAERQKEKKQSNKNAKDDN